MRTKTSPQGHISKVFLYDHPSSFPKSKSGLWSLFMLFFFTLFSGLGCDEGLEEVSSNGIGVEPRNLNFNTIGIGEFESREVEILQLGATALEVSRIYLEEVSSGRGRPECDRITAGSAGPLEDGEFADCDMIIDARPMLPLTIEPNRRNAVTLLYKPTRPIEMQERLRLVIESNARDTPRAVVEISFASESPILLTEDQVTFPGLGGLARIAVQNIGPAPLQIDEIELSGTTIAGEGSDGPAEFIWENDEALPRPLTLAGGGESIELLVRFTPAEGGSGAASLRIRSNDPNQSERTIRLISDELSATLVLSPATLSFSGAGSAFLSMNNSGLRPINVQGLRFNPEGGSFTLVGAAPARIEGGESVTVEVSYDGGDAPADAALLIDCDADNAIGGTLSVPLQVNGGINFPQLSADPAILFFNGVAQGDSMALSFTLSSSGIGPVSLDAVLLDPMGDSGFEITSGDESGLLEEGAQREVTVRFTRAAGDAAQRANSVSFQSDSSEPISVTLFADP